MDLLVGYPQGLGQRVGDMGVSQQGGVRNTDPKCRDLHQMRRPRGLLALQLTRTAVLFCLFCASFLWGEKLLLSEITVSIAVGCVFWPEAVHNEVAAKACREGGQENVDANHSGYPGILDRNEGYLKDMFFCQIQKIGKGSSFCSYRTKNVLVVNFVILCFCPSRLFKLFD